MRRTLVATIAALALALTASGTAYAQATLEGYTDEGPRIQDRFPGDPQAVTQEQAATPSNEGSDLPFTGLDLGLIAAAGGLLLALGFGMRRVVRAPESA